MISLTIEWDTEINRQSFCSDLKDLVKKHGGKYKTIKKSQEDINGTESKLNKAQTSISAPESEIAYTYREN